MAVAEVVSSRGAPTPAGTSVFSKHNWDMEIGYLWLIGWGIYHLMDGAFISLNGWGVYDLMGWAFVMYWAGHFSINGQGLSHLMGGALMA